MAGSVNLGNVQDADGNQAVFTLTYDDTLKASAFVGINNTINVVQARIVGAGADGSTEDPNKTFALLLDPGQADQVAIPSNGAKSIQLAVNDRGKIGGYNTYLG